MSSQPAKLPFIFVKRHGVLIDNRLPSESVILCRELATPAIFAEVSRFIEDDLPWKQVSDEAFNQAVAEVYHGDATTAAQKMVEGLDEELDLVTLAEAVPETEDLLEKEADAPIIRLINALLSEAVREDVSDIHIETFEKRLVVRFRKDGILQQVLEPKRALAPLLVSRIKVMAKLDIAEKRIPQDGRISLRVAGREVDIRVSTMPSSDGERVVLRLLDKKAGRLDLKHLGMANSDYQKIRNLIKKPHGIILVTGPTGSGKTTTLYACLTALNEKSRNILTVEDPIEYNLEGIGQMQVNPKIDMTFARGLRAILRQDPDVVMVGEIRDVETAEIAVQASLTGHLVLSTLHTNSAVGAITRLVDMGIEPFLIASSLIGVIAQRLVRVLCQQCKREYHPNATECRDLLALETNDCVIYEAVGCDACQGTGYKGRLGIYEIVLIDEKLRQMIHDRVSEQMIEQHARSQSASIRQDGRQKILTGLTTIEEVIRVTQED